MTVTATWQVFNRDMPLRLRWLSFAVLVTLLMFGLIAWQAVNSFRVTKELNEAFLSGERFRDRIVTLQQEQMLTLAMLVATNSSGWEDRYAQLERELYASIRLALQRAEPGYDSAILENLRQAHERLRERAGRAIELAKLGHSREGLGMLTSPKFQRARKAFNRQIGAFIADYQAYLRSRLLAERNKSLISLFVGFLIFLASLAVWMLLLRKLDRQRTRLKREVAERELAEQRLRKLAGYLQNAAEQERAAIARELHDETGQSLAAANIDLARLRRRLPVADSESRDLLDRNMQRVTHTMDGIQRLFSGLRPSILDNLGLTAAIEWLADECGERSGIACRLDLAVDESLLDADARTALFRIAQEALSNVSRHAQATEARIRLHRNGPWIELIVADNGRGIGPTALRDPGSFGLTAMRERALAFGGDLEIHSEAGGGTRVMVRVPVAEAKADGPRPEAGGSVKYTGTIESDR